MTHKVATSIPQTIYHLRNDLSFGGHYIKKNMGPWQGLIIVLTTLPELASCTLRKTTKGGYVSEIPGGE